MSFPRARQLVSLAAVLLLAPAACSRRERIDERTWVVLPSDESWTLSTHPAVAVDGAGLRDRLRRALERTGRFRVASERLSERDRRLSAAATLALTAVEEHDGEHRLSVRLGFLPPLEGAERELVVDADARGALSGEGLLDPALELAVGRLVVRLDLRRLSDEEVVRALHDGGTLAEAALDELAARRHPAAFAGLVERLTMGDVDRARSALSALVVINDRRAVRPIIEQTRERGPDFLVEALFALGALGGEDAEAFLSLLDGGHYDPRVRRAATEALELSARRTGRRAGN